MLRPFEVKYTTEVEEKRNFNLKGLHKKDLRAGTSPGSSVID